MNVSDETNVQTGVDDGGGDVDVDGRAIAAKRDRRKRPRAQPDPTIPTSVKTAFWLCVSVFFGVLATVMPEIGKWLIFHYFTIPVK